MKNSHFTLLITIIFSFQFIPFLALNSDGSFLLALKYSILSDPLSVLDNWDYLDQTPCTWNGVVCSPDLRVIGLTLPDNQLLGSLPSDLGLIEHLQHLDLSNNFFNGTLPVTLFNASQLVTLSLSSNVLSGDIPVFSHSSLSFLNLSDNAFGGPLPVNFTSAFNNLTVLSLRGNYFSGSVPSGFPISLEVLDLSSNLFNGSLPSDLGVGPSLRYLNISYNKFTGAIPADFAAGVPEIATIDVSYNNLTGQVPGSKPFGAQNPDFFSGNQELCGKPLKNECVIPSTLSTPPNVSASISPAIAVIPKPVESNSNSNSNTGPTGNHSNGGGGLKPATIAGITVADLAGVGILGVVFFYLYQLRNKKLEQEDQTLKKQTNINTSNNLPPSAKKISTNLENDHFLVQINNPTTTNSNSNKLHKKCFTYCVRAEESATSDTRTSSDSSENEEDNDENKREKPEDGGPGGGGGGGGVLMMVDGETELEADTLLKASAYILGASGSSIVYKAVLQDGTTFAVRRLGEICVEKLKDFEGHIKGIAKIRHPNLVKVRGFYWGSDEKLVIYDYVSNGSLATSSYKKGGSTPYHLPLEARLRIARGLARGLTYIHEKRYVHANIKPSNILLTHDMDAIISDLGLSWLVYGNNSSKYGSARHFGSKRSMGSYDGSQDFSASSSPYINPFGSSNGFGSPYQAPESLKNLKPNPKWDVYSFGIVLLELLTGKVYLDREMGQWTPSSNGLEDRFWVLRVADVALRAEIQGKEEAMMGILKLGFSCASLVPQKRPSMKEALQVLEKVSLSFVH